MPEKNDQQLVDLLESIRFRLSSRHTESLPLDLQHGGPSIAPVTRVATPDPISEVTAALERFQSAMKASFEELRNELHEFKAAAHEAFEAVIHDIQKTEDISGEENPVPQLTVQIQTPRSILAPVENDCGKDVLLSSIPSAPGKSIEPANKNGKRKLRIRFQYHYHKVCKRRSKKKDLAPIIGPQCTQFFVSQGKDLRSLALSWFHQKQHEDLLCLLVANMNFSSVGVFTGRTRASRLSQANRVWKPGVLLCVKAQWNWSRIFSPTFKKQSRLVVDHCLEVQVLYGLNGRIDVHKCQAFVVCVGDIELFDSGDPYCVRNCLRGVQCVDRRLKLSRQGLEMDLQVGLDALMLRTTHQSPELKYLSMFHTLTETRCLHGCKELQEKLQHGTLTFLIVIFVHGYESVWLGPWTRLDSEVK